jgi:hypothetical protein
MFQSVLFINETEYFSPIGEAGEINTQAFLLNLSPVGVLKDG